MGLLPHALESLAKHWSLIPHLHWPRLTWVSPVYHFNEIHGHFCLHRATTAWASSGPLVGPVMITPFAEKMATLELSKKSTKQPRYMVYV